MTYEPAPNSDVYYAHYALCDPPDMDHDGWVTYDWINASRGEPSGSDGADYLAGLEELVENGYAERDGEADRWRLTPLGRRKCRNG